ncbi:hypothetical protein C2U69_33240 [Cupriavidus pinatubonensis]|nr:hypothetical protein C2U69_33240 [Cupriavidus pinatubonensis]
MVRAGTDRSLPDAYLGCPFLDDPRRFQFRNVESDNYQHEQQAGKWKSGAGHPCGSACKAADHVDPGFGSISETIEQIIDLNYGRYF